MRVERIWTGNSYRNFNYLVVCEESGDALAIDPLDFKQCLSVAAENGWTISTIVNTHEHGDHTGGNKGMVAATGARVVAHHDAAAHIPGMNQGVGAGDVIRVGTSVELECLDTPGHTMSHVCLLSHTPQAALFCGDTLFNAGVGNCHNGGHPEALFETFQQQIENLGAETLIYPGHDYLTNNLRFTLDREPDNIVAKDLLNSCVDQDPTRVTTTLADERRINTFFRLQEPAVVEKLVSDYPDIGEAPDARAVFLKLRELRNSW